MKRCCTLCYLPAPTEKSPAAREPPASLTRPLGSPSVGFMTRAHWLPELSDSSPSVILTMVNIALGNAGPLDCEAADANHNGQVTVDEILTAVNNALGGCVHSP
jgi:hypothetical protein